MAEPPLAGQTVVVLGGSAGIGLATARRARAEGAHVVITGRDPERLARAAADLGSTETAQGTQSTQIQTAPFDVADETALHQFFDQLSQQLGGPIGHVLVSAGGPYYAPFAELDVADAMRYVSRSLALPLNVARFASPRMGPGGSLTFIGGTGARRPGKGLSIIGAVSAAAPALVANLALEVAPVRVNLIAPGFVDTPLSATLLGAGLDARREELRRSLPVHRVTEPSDVAALAVHLMVNPVLTGATYDIDGGQQLL
jgi:NAD(P)-dependent dehydrogenase (short-subunit alcohol dehydrogenase family)